MKNISLTIAIPTYNRADYLDSCLKSIFNQNFNSEIVEILVSNNSSIDNTDEIVEKYKHHNNFNYIKQKENLGFGGNLLSLVSNAKGEFCWFVGDDDFIIEGAIEELVNLIHLRPEIDFYYAKPLPLSFDKYMSFDNFDSSKLNLNVSKNNFKYTDLFDWQELLDPKFSSTFMGEFMAGVFRSKIWLNTNFTFKRLDNMENIENVYTHSVIYANSFINVKTIYISTPMILTLEGTRDWWSRIGYIVVVLLKDLLELYREKGLRKSILRKTYIHYIKMSLPYVFRYCFNTSKFKDKLNLNIYIRFLFSNSFITFIAIFSMIQNRLNKLINKV